MIWALLGRYDCDRFGSDLFDLAEGCGERYSGFTARWPAAGWEDGMLCRVVVENERIEVFCRIQSNERDRSKRVKGG